MIRVFPLSGLRQDLQKVFLRGPRRILYLIARRFIFFSCSGVNVFVLKNASIFCFAWLFVRGDFMLRK